MRRPILHVTLNRVEHLLESWFWLIVLILWLTGIAFTDWRARATFQAAHVDTTLIHSRQTTVQTDLAAGAQDRATKRAADASSLTGMNPQRFGVQ